MLQAKKAQIQPFTSINQSQSASKEEKPVTETIDVLLLYFLELTDTHEGWYLLWSDFVIFEWFFRD